MSKWTDTRVTHRLGISHPILQGPFGRGGSTALLAATVSNLGGLGSFGANELAPEDILKAAADIRKLSNKPFALNLWVSTFDAGGDSLDQETYDRVVEILAPYYRELGVAPPPRPSGNAARNFDDQAAALIEAAPAVFSFVFGIPPAEILRACREKGIVTAGGASTVEEAVALEEAGVDLVVASGFEAGGHRTSFLKRDEATLMGTFSLVPQIADRVKIPVIAAGGIADGRGIAAALTLGAAAVQIGTAFFATEESGASAAHRELLFSPEVRTTGLSRAFTGRFARGIYNRFASEMKAHEAQLARYPAQSWIVAPLRAAALAQGRTDLVALWAGQSAPLVRHRKAADLFAALVDETENIFRARHR